jgi:hypothetical protein
VTIANFCLHLFLQEISSFNKVICAGLAGLFACGSINMPAHALTKGETMSLSYEQVKGSGLANRCPSVIGEETITLSGGKQYKVTDLCLEPKSWQVSDVIKSKCLCEECSHSICPHNIVDVCL